MNYKSPLELANELIKGEDLEYLRNWVSDNKPYLASPRWSFDNEQKTAFRDIAAYDADNYNELLNESDNTITQWLKQHGFNYELSHGDYDYETKGRVGRNWVNTGKGNQKTARNRILLKVRW
jgi:hypothetical protein